MMNVFSRLAGGILAAAALAAAAGVDGALVPHRDHHAGDVGAVYIASQRAAHLVRVQRLIIV